MIVSFTGTSSCGKTTLLNEFKNHFNDWVIIPELTRELRKRGFVINDGEDNYNDTQSEITKLHLKVLSDYENDNKNYILDRCLIDGYIYTQYLFDEGKISDNVLSQALQALELNKDKYDIIFYPNPYEVKLKYDGVRSNNEVFRNKIIQLYEDLILNKFDNVYTISGNTEQRMNQIKHILQDYVNR